MQLAPAPQTAPKRLSILGATGSIGCSTLALVQEHPEQFCIEALTAQDNVDKLIEQAVTFRPALAVIGNEAHYQTLKDALSPYGITCAAGAEAICEAAQRPVDTVMMAIVGAVSLRPTFCAIEAGSSIAFASKECLVCAGELMMEACRKSGATLLPVDSEHNAIFQVFDFEQPDAIEKITLTASGGPFRSWTAEAMAKATPEQAVAHPNWSMGAKISVDSATMMNKALEVIEAYHLFPLRSEQIEVVVHPESIIHSFVHYRDGSVLAQLGMPDMRIPIAHTLSWPQRMKTQNPALSLTEMGALTFEAPDAERFPALRIVRDVLAAKPGAAIAFNAANEVAVEAFLAGTLPFGRIAPLVEAILPHYLDKSVSSLDEVVYLNDQARQEAKQHIHSSS
ncbi:MAG: 1-deoxy-D-xylulose-5-phosphate reductoisomerase [Rickettsiales bacterium]|nr:1-deoxy-D-xylulose-5-phosphate reductoisomerase [Rickettsiales bacterium]